MKKLYLLSGMIVLGAAASINAEPIYPGGLKAKRIEKIEAVQRGKLACQRQLARPAIYTMVDALIQEEWASGHIDENGQWIEDTPEKIVVDWAAVFRLIDSMKGVIDVNEYETYDSQKPLLWVAVEQGNFSVVKTLLEKYEANPNYSRCMGGHEEHEVCHKMSLLRLAQQKKDFTIALLLRHHGANL